MKKLWVVVSLAGAMVVSNAFASMTVVLIDNTSQYSYGDGGEFRAVGNSGLDSVVDWAAYAASTQGTVSSATDGSSWGYSSSLNGLQYFQTFCIQTTVYFNPGSTYNATVADAITLGTAWLYSQFAAGTLSGYNYTYGSGRSTTAGALQQAIWFFQNQPGGATNSFVQAAEAAVGGASAAFGESNGKYGVGGLDLTDPNGNQAAQDQLIISVPEASTIIAGALLALPLGASAFRILRRNRTA